MAEHIVLVENLNDWKPTFPALPLVAAKDYLARPEYLNARHLRILNLCRSYRYLSVGYYCSLLAEARRHWVIPNVRAINDLSHKSIYGLDIEEIDKRVQRTLRAPYPTVTANTFELDVFFGQCPETDLQELALELFNSFRAPLLRVEFRLLGKWRLSKLKIRSLHNLSASQAEVFNKALMAYLSKRWQRPRVRARFRYDLAILHNPQETLPPSDARALKNFVKAGRHQGINVELITKLDFSRLAEYDALFIRETTAIDHYTYQFAKKAENEGLVVIDDSNSILKCTNKVYLEELLHAQRIKTPKTVIVSRDSLNALETQIPYPLVLKMPDGSFSRGVFKVANRAELTVTAMGLFKTSDLILAQEFLYTPYDWRVGLLNKTPLYVCQYYMSKKHWQIYDHKGGKTKGGGYKTFAVEDVPDSVLKAAVKAANLIGDGLYGVDLKQTDSGVVIIEVNDNPSIDAGIEDAILKEALYKTVMGDFIRRLDKLRNG
jgi:glutathione synthase/RimK-type ligase-like ATP-grasp enzyme